jgi:hypothetical protein
METETTQSNQRYKLIQDLAQTGYPTRYDKRHNVLSYTTFIG